MSYVRGQLSSLLMQNVKTDEPEKSETKSSTRKSKGSKKDKTIETNVSQIAALFAAKEDKLVIKHSSKKRAREVNSEKEKSPKKVQKNQKGNGTVKDTKQDASSSASDEEDVEEVEAPIQKTKDSKSPKNKSHDQDVSGLTEKDKRTLFVGNVPVGTTSKATKITKKLKQTFKKFGEVESVRLRSVPIAATAIPSSGDFKMMRKVAVNKNNFLFENGSCNAYVVYKDENSVKLAIKEGRNILFEGSHLRIDAVAKLSKKGVASTQIFDHAKSVFVGNLPFDIAEEAVFNHFNQHVPVVAVRLIKDKHASTGKGFGYVLLKSAQDVPKALALNNEMLEERKIRITKCDRIKMLAGANNTPQNIKSFQGTKASFNHKKAAKLRIKNKSKNKLLKKKPKK